MQASRIIQVISTRMAGADKQYLLSTTKIFYNNDSKTETILITPKEASAHLKTGKWHTISLTNLNNYLEEPIAIQVQEISPLQVKFEKYVENYIQRGEEQFSKVFKKNLITFH